MAETIVAVIDNEDITVTVGDDSLDITVSAPEQINVSIGDDIDFDTEFSLKTTADLTELTNLYYTDARVSSNSDVSSNTSLRHDATTVSDTPTVNLSISGQEVSAVVIPGGISHTSISDVGTNTHAQIDSYLDDLSGVNTGDQIISDETISITDITANNVSTSSHGFAPKGNGSSTAFLNGTGAYSTPTGSGNVSTSGTPVVSDFAKFANGTDIEGRSYSEVRTDLNIADGATANSTDTILLSRTNHTDTQTASTISDFNVEVSNNASVVANTAKVSNVTHTGEVTGDTSLTVGPTAISNKTLVTAVGADHVLIADATDGTLKKALISDFASAGGDMAAATYDPTTVSGDVFDMDNMAEGTNKILTAAERTILSNTSNTNSGDNAINTTYSGLVSNVSTNLSEGTSTETTVDINSSDGDNATLASASTSRAGLLTKAKFDEIVTNNSKISYTDATDVGLNTTHRGLTNNPHSVDKSDVSLSNVPNVDCTDASNISSGKLPSSVLPPVALVTVGLYANETLMLAATTEEGDVAVRSDENKSYMRNAGLTGTMTDWTELQTPTDIVLSVNSQTGTIVLNQDHIASGSTYVQTENNLTDAQVTILSNTSNTNTGDNSVNTLYSSLVTNATHTGDVTGDVALTIGADKVLDSHINWGTGATQVNTADIPELTNLYYTEDRVAANTAVAANTLKVSYTDATDVGLNTTHRTSDGKDHSDVVANNAKVTNATHDGEVTGSTSLTIADNIIDEANLKLDETPTNDYVLTADSTKTGGMKWAEASSGSGGVSWSVITGTTQTAVIDNGYILNNVAQVVVTLPTTAAVGSIVRISGLGAGGWKLAQNASEYIYFGNTTSTTGIGGYLESTHSKDSIELVCVVADTAWSVISSVGNITIV